MMDMKETLTNLFAAIYIVLLGGLICFLSWNGWASAFNLPRFSYWHWVATFTAIRFIRDRVKKGD